MTNLFPITQIFNYPRGFHSVAATDQAVKNLESQSGIQTEIDQILVEVGKLLEKTTIPGASITFIAKPEISSDSNSYQLGTFNIRTSQNRFDLDLSCEKYGSDIRSISVSSRGDIDDFNYSIDTNNSIKDQIYRKLVESLFEHFKSQLAISFSSENPSERISNCRNNAERVETSPYSLIAGDDFGIQDTECVQRGDGYYICNDGDNPISFRNKDNPRFSLEMAELLQKMGFKNSKA